MKFLVKAKIFMNSSGRFFHYEPLFTSSFRKNLIIPGAVMSSNIFVSAYDFNNSLAMFRHET